MFNKFFKSKSLEQKSASAISLLQLLGNTFAFNKSPQKSIEYYFEACPVFTATEFISDAVAAIDLVVKDTKKDEFLDDHDVLKLMKKPNPFTDGKLFMKEISSFYTLTGNNYINIIGTGKPSELNIINPTNVTIESNERDGFPQDYTIGGNGSSKGSVYSRQGDKRFVDTINNEIIQLRKFNPQYSSNNLTGIGVFAGCELEISQYILASIHNNSLLKNQARPSGLLTYKGDDSLSDEQVNGVKSLLSDQLSGANNAGKTTFLNGKFDWVQLSESVKDMDFPTLKKNTAEAIYNAAKIPLPLVSPDNMTLANMDAAKFLFYDNVIIPQLDRILAFLTKHLMSRYPNSENLIITFDPTTIEALEARKVANAKIMSDIGVLTIDEIRTLLGYETITGGDIIYQPMNLVPVGSDRFTSDNRDTPAKKELSTEKAEYIKLMSSMKDLKGKRVYSDEVIKENLKKFY